MSKLLYIKANAKTDNESRTYHIANSFIDEYKKLHPDDEVITLDLYSENIGFLPQGKLSELHKIESGEGKNHPILKYAYQFWEADKYVIAEPLWNLSIPAILKAYIDYICVNGVTFEYTADGPVGLCKGKKAVNITSRGGNYSSGPFVAYEMGNRYLRVIFGFLGINDFLTISAEGLDTIGTNVDTVVENAVKEAKEVAKNF